MNHRMHSLVDETNKLLGKIDVLSLQCSYKSIYGINGWIFHQIHLIRLCTTTSNQITYYPNLVPSSNDGHEKMGQSLLSLALVACEEVQLLGAYNMSKAADIMMVKNIASEFGQFNVRANAIAPGLIRTDFAKALWENPEILKVFTDKVPMQRIGEPEEIAGVALMLASEAGSYINGQTLVVDGGSTIV